MDAIAPPAPSLARSLSRCAWLVCAASLTLACRDEAKAPEGAASGPSEARAPLVAAARQDETPFSAPALCRVAHRGMFLDLGTDASHARRSFALGPFTDVTTDTWSDLSYTRFGAPNVSYDFWLDAPREQLELRVRAKPGSSGMLAASIDQTRLGSVRVRGDTFQTLAFPKLERPLAAGRHQLGLRWTGRAAGDGSSLGMIEWIHWPDPGRPVHAYRAPRERSLRDDVVLGGVLRRSIVLGTPSSLRCPVLLARDATLELGVGYQGEGSGVARVLVRREGAAPQVIAERRVSGTEGWTDLSLDLAPLGQRLLELELEAVSDSPAGRIAFSEPRLVVPAPSGDPAPRARLVVVVVASGLHRELLPPFERSRRLRHLNRLATESVRFPEYRAPSSVVSAVFASLLSGLPPLAHGLSAPRLRLRREVLTLADRLREVSGESALFTGVPHTRAAFGFERGWHHFEEFSPVSDIAASAPLEHGRAWLERALEGPSDVPRLLMVHVRGGHPPWDLSRDEVAELEPPEYVGLLEARRGGIILANVRGHRRASQRRLQPADWTRLEALQLAALEKQDAALGALIELLERRGIWHDTLFVFTGDVAMGDPPEIPFGDGLPLGEDRLVVPLWIKFPAERFAGSQVLTPVSSTDLALTLASSLGIQLPDELGALDLQRLAAGTGPALGRGRMATLGNQYSMRHGPWLLRGTSPKVPSLCETSVDPACVHDVLEANPLVAGALWRATFEAHRRERGAGAGHAEPATLDPDSAAALQVWGD